MRYLSHNGQTFAFLFIVFAMIVRPLFAGNYVQNAVLPVENMQVTTPSRQYDTPPKFVRGRAPFTRHSSLPGHDQRPCAVIIQFTVGADGKTGNFQVAGSAGPPCAQLAINALKDWRFEPGQRHGKPVPVVMRAPFVLKPSYN
jgi:TonB family protein